MPSPYPEQIRNITENDLADLLRNYASNLADAAVVLPQNHVDGSAFLALTEEHMNQLKFPLGVRINICALQTDLRKAYMCGGK